MSDSVGSFRILGDLVTVKQMEIYILWIWKLGAVEQDFNLLSDLEQSSGSHK